jgi:alpha-mannosidase
LTHRFRLPLGRSLALSAAALVLLPLSLQAQSDKDVAGITATLPAPAQQVIERLGELNHLPATGWRYHDGDLTHGEAPSVDDSSWQTVEDSNDPPPAAVWYRKWIEIPKTFHGYDLTGTRIWFDFNAYAHGPLTEIIYFNGRRVALGEDIEPIVLFDNAKAGDRVLVAVKLLAGGEVKHFRGATLKVDFADTRPNPNDLRTELLSATELIPSLSQNVSQDQATLVAAAQSVDLHALDAANQTAFDASLKAAGTKLETLKPMLQTATYHETGNSHIDAAWLWPVSDSIDVVRRTFGTALQLMNEYPWYTYTQSAAAYNEWMANKYPELNDEIKKRVKEGRWEVLGGMWVEPDLNMPDGESQARSLLIGKRFFQKEYGVDVRIGWNPDSFGYNWQLPQIYKKSGIDYFVTQKMAWNDTNQLPLKLFWWESPDGSKVLTYFPHDYANTNLNPVRLATDMKNARKDVPNLTEMMDLYGVGDHGGGPTRAMLDEGAHWKDSDKIIPNMKFGTAQSFFNDVQGKIGGDSPTWNYDLIAQGWHAPGGTATGPLEIPTWKDELYLEYHRGVFTTQAEFKRSMRESEEQVLNAEKYASLAWLDGQSYPGQELTDSWKTVTFNDFHDLAAGSGLGIIYKEGQQEFARVRLATDAISKQSLATLAARIDTHVPSSDRDGVSVLVVNPLAWQRSGLVELPVQFPAEVKGDVTVLDAGGKAVPSEIVSSNAGTHQYRILARVQDVPSLGYEVLHVVSGGHPVATDVKVQGLTLENDKLRVTVDQTTGCITSLYDKAAQAETLAPSACGNELQAFKDTPKDYDAWNIDPGTLDQPPTLLHSVDSVSVVEHTPLRAVIRVSRTWSKSHFVQDITLTAGSDQVVVDNNIDWHETHVLLKAAFPLAASSPKATYEIPYGTIERPTARDNSWEKARFEVPALRWADLGNTERGFSLINESKYGYDAAGNVLRLSLLRSPTWPDPDADRGEHKFRYALYPHAGTWQQAMSVRHGYEFNYPLIATQVEAHTGTLPASHSFVSVKGDDVVLTALKKAEDSDGLVVHLYEWAGKDGEIELTVPPGATGATVTNLMEKPEGQPLPISGDHVTVPIHPYEILSLRVDYPHHAS